MTFLGIGKKQIDAANLRAVEAEKTAGAALLRTAAAEARARDASARDVVSALNHATATAEGERALAAATATAEGARRESAELRDLLADTTERALLARADAFVATRRYEKAEAEIGALRDALALAQSDISAAQDRANEAVRRLELAQKQTVDAVTKTMSMSPATRARYIAKVLKNEA